MALKYGIGGIGWYNFERLIKTLLKKVIGPGVTSFGGSKDQGRDASFSGVAAYPSKKTNWSGQWSFQVKYIDLEDQGGSSAARSALKSAFKKEMNAIRNRRGKTENYVLVTDVPMTATSRAELAAVAKTSGFAGNFAVVDGNEVCEWLDIYPELRRSFPQLLGLADLNQIVHADVYNRSKAFFEQWAPRLALFVETEAFIKAQTTLRQQRFLVLDGPPEVGKSMIAASLALIYASEGFEVYDVRGPNQLFTALNKTAQQLFIADDAIGSIDLDPGQANAWTRDLAGIIRSLDKDHLLIWTARHYILEEALESTGLGDALDRFPGEHEVVVEVGDLGILEKAEMLYNHAKHAGLASVVRKALRGNALDLAHHPNFTPERIRQMVEFLRTTTFDDSTHVDREIAEFLKNPGLRWAKAYRALGSSEKTLLVSLLDLDEPAELTDLRRAYEQRSAQVEERSLTFVSALSRLKHSFVTISKSYQGIECVNFKHPSLRDVVLREMRENPAARKRYIEQTSPLGLAALIRGAREGIKCLTIQYSR